LGGGVDAAILWPRYTPVRCTGIHVCSDAGTGATVGTGTNSQTRELAVVLADFMVVSKAVTALYRRYKAVIITDSHTNRISRWDESRFHFRWNESCS